MFQVIDQVQEIGGPLNCSTVDLFVSLLSSGPAGGSGSRACKFFLFWCSQLLISSHLFLYLQGSTLRISTLIIRTLHHIQAHHDTKRTSTFTPGKSSRAAAKWRTLGKVSSWGDSPNLLWTMIINWDGVEHSTGERKWKKVKCMPKVKESERKWTQVRESKRKWKPKVKGSEWK